MKTKNYFLMFTLSFVFLIFGNFSLAEDQAVSAKSSKDQVQSKIEMHEQMSEMHTKTAACLKSGKSEMACQQEMMSMCKEMHSKMGNMTDEGSSMGKMDCPMMSGMGKMSKNQKHKSSPKMKSSSEADHDSHHEE